jgi:hypothetical protein
MPSTAGRYIAKDRGAFDVEPNRKVEPEPEIKPARAPMFEFVAEHMKPEDLARFVCWYEALTF